jgi:hypothetical protein
MSEEEKVILVNPFENKKDESNEGEELNLFAPKDETVEMAFIEKYTVKLPKTESNGFAIWKSMNESELQSPFLAVLHENMLTMRRLSKETNKDLLEVVKNKSLRDWFEKSGINFNFGKGGM